MNESSRDPDALLTYEQVAKLLSVDKTTLRRMVSDGEFPAPLKIGRQLRWRMQRVLEYLAALEVVQVVQRQASKKARKRCNDEQQPTNESTGEKTPVRKPKPG